MTDDDRDAVSFRLDGYYQLNMKPPPVTWRHRLYWFLRKLIDPIYPKG